MDQLAERAKALRADGKTVVLAHGVFDLLHLGHVRHLKEARSFGDALIVTITSDAFVNKGPGRPVFSAQMRAEMLAAMEYVDWVGVNDAATAAGVLRAIKPTIYAKGSEYAKSDDDITGGIVAEREAVESGGGKIMFTDDVVLSSSSLINRHLSIYEPDVAEFLAAFRKERRPEDLIELLDKVQDFRVVLVGDTIIDEYHYVTPLGKSPKENMIATRYTDRELFAGGVIAAANHVANFCREVEVITTLGANDPHERLVRDSLAPNVTLRPVHLADRPTVRKRRFVETGYLRKLFEVYYFDETPIRGAEEASVLGLIEQYCPDSDVVIVTDFGHGMLTSMLIDALTDVAPFLAVNAQSNSANHGYNMVTRYSRADYVCIDAPEARLAVTDKFSPIEDIIQAKLSTRIDCPNFIVTHGKNGCVTFDRDNGVSRIPSFTRTVVDTVGAGDAFLAVTSPLVAAGGAMGDIGFIGNAVGGIKVGIVGHRQSVARVPLIKYITALMK